MPTGGHVLPAPGCGTASMQGRIWDKFSLWGEGHITARYYRSQGLGFAAGGGGPVLKQKKNADDLFLSKKIVSYYYSRTVY